MNFPTLETYFNHQSRPLNPGILKQFHLYRQLLQAANEHMNLTAIVDDRGVEIKHFLDSIWFPFPSPATRLLDVGSGAGFPGIPLHLLHSHLHTVLLEPNQKKAQFLQDLIQTLQLNQIQVVSERAEIWIQQHREQFDVVTARAVAPLRILLELTAPFVTVEGTVMLLKGPTVHEELNQAKKAIDVLGLKLQKIESIDLPDIHESRTVVYLKKIKATPMPYPRRFALIKSKPL
jgi:16S rRNA (guanine527-N7)-methyltransferase